MSNIQLHIDKESVVSKHYFDWQNVKILDVDIKYYSIIIF